MWWIVLIVGIFLIVVGASVLMRDKKYDGIIVVKKEGEKTIYSLEVSTDIDEIENKDVMVFKVAKEGIAD